MRFEQFEQLKEVQNSKSITKAAQKLYMSTQGLSLSIKDMETKLRFPLLNRSHTGVTLTPEAIAILDIYDDFRQRLKEVQKNSLLVPKVSNYNLPCCHFSLTFFDDAIFKKISATRPDVNIVIVEDTYINVAHQVQSRKAEIGIIYQTFMDDVLLTKIPQNLEFLPLSESKIAIQVTKAHPLACKKKISVTEVINYPLIMADTISSDTTSLFKFIRQDFSDADIQFTNSNFYYEHLVSTGKKVGITLAFTNTLAPIIPSPPLVGCKTLLIDYPLKNIIGYIYQKNAELSDIAKALINLFVLV